MQANVQIDALNDAEFNENTPFMKATPKYT
jgi:hypothetical protein